MIPVFAVIALLFVEAEGGNVTTGNEHINIYTKQHETHKNKIKESQWGWEFFPAYCRMGNSALKLKFLDVNTFKAQIRETRKTAKLSCNNIFSTIELLLTF